MKIDNIIGSVQLSEANITDRILKDPSKAKMLVIAWRHDDTLPPSEVAKLGPKPDEKAVAQEWSNMLERKLSRTNYGDLSRDFKFAEWLTKLYTSGSAVWEDISGEGGEALGAWNALSIRGLLDKQHQDINSYKTLKALQRAVMNNSRYMDDLKRIRNAEQVAKMKKDKKDLLLIDDDRFWAAIPFNYGACYVFNNTGHISTFCTGSSGGPELFNSYSARGLMIMIADKSNINDEDGKWQLQASSAQLVNSVQKYRNDQGQHFGEIFPGLMRRIIKAMIANADEIKKQSAALTNDGRGYDINREIAMIKSKYPMSLTKAKDEPDEPEIPILDKIGDKWYREFLDPTFTMNFDPDTDLDNQTVRINRNDGQFLRGQAKNIEDIMTRVRDSRPDWLLPGSITSIELI